MLLFAGVGTWKQDDIYTFLLVFEEVSSSSKVCLFLNDLHYIRGTNQLV